MTEESAERILRDRGLTAVGRHWLCAADHRLRSQLHSIDRNQKQFQRARRELEQRLESNESLGRLLSEKTQRIAQLERQAASTRDTVQRRQLADVLGRLRAEQSVLQQRYLTPDQVPDDASLRAIVIEWTNARNALAVTALTYSETDVLYQISNQYESLRGDTQVRRAMATLGPHQELRGGNEFAAAAPRVAEARRMAFSADAPLYRVAGQWRSNVLIGPAAPTGCTLTDQGPPLILPEMAARAAGLLDHEKEPLRRPFKAPDGRQFEVQVVRLPRIWLGNQEIANVEAYILPPEGEDLGVLLNPDYLGGNRVQRRPQQLRLTVVKNR